MNHRRGRRKHQSVQRHSSDVEGTKAQQREVEDLYDDSHGKTFARMSNTEQT